MVGVVLKKQHWQDYWSIGNFMNSKKAYNREKLPGMLRFALFCTSYIPLFILIVIKQLFGNIEYLHFGGLNFAAVSVFFSKYFVAFILISLTVYGGFGVIIFLIGMRTITKDNGHRFRVKKVHNKNTESVGYIATYLVPFMFQSLSTLYEIISFFILFGVIYTIYTHSTLIIVNPILNIKYSLYDICYVDEKSGQEKEGTFIIDSHYVEIGDVLKSKKIGVNLYYAIMAGEDNE